MDQSWKQKASGNKLEQGVGYHLSAYIYLSLSFDWQIPLTLIFLNLNAGPLWS